MRLRSNCSVIWVKPLPLLLVICGRPGIWPNCRSSGVATEDAVVSASAPGSCAETWIVGQAHVRQRRHRQLHVGDRRPSDDDRDHQQRGRDRAADEAGGDVHGSIPAVAVEESATWLGGADATGVPGGQPVLALGDDGLAGLEPAA